MLFHNAFVVEENPKRKGEKNVQIPRSTLSHLVQTILAFAIPMRARISTNTPTIMSFLVALLTEENLIMYGEMISQIPARMLKILPVLAALLLSTVVAICLTPFLLELVSKPHFGCKCKFLASCQKKFFSLALAKPQNLFPPICSEICTFA